MSDSKKRGKVIEHGRVELDLLLMRVWMRLYFKTKTDSVNGVCRKRHINVSLRHTLFWHLKRFRWYPRLSRNIGTSGLDPCLKLSTKYCVDYRLKTCRFQVDLVPSHFIPGTWFRPGKDKDIFSSIQPCVGVRPKV